MHLNTTHPHFCKRDLTPSTYTNAVDHTVLYSNLMMAYLERAETCSWFVFVCYKYSCVFLTDALCILVY
jgi:hypothetical protein